MKKTFLFLCLLLVSLGFKTASAQSTYQIYVSDIDTVERVYDVGQQVDGSFTLSNLSDIAQSDMYYTVSSGLYSEENMTVNNVFNISKEVGPLYVKGLSKDVVSFSYTLPKSLVGNSAIKITVKLKDGTILAEGVYPLSITGETSVESLGIKEGYLKISGFDQKIDPLVGPTVYSGENIDLYLTIPKTEKEHDIKAVLKLYDRSEKEEFLLKTVDLKKIKTGTKESVSVISLPVDLKPLVYLGVISFEADGLEISPVNVRYIIAGSIATIRNMTTETLRVKKGEVFNVNVVYGGQPLDELRPEKQINTSSTTITVVATNEKGDIVSEVTQPVVISEDSNNLVIPMTANVSAKGLTLKGYVKSENGIVLDEYKTVLPYAKDIKRQESYIQDSGKVIVNIAILSILVLIMFFFFIRKLNLKSRLPVAILLFGIVASFVIVKMDVIYAAIAPDQQTYLNGLDENSNPVWSVIQESSNTRYDRFSITSVASPLPPKVKIYEPGERFSLSFSATYGECNNELYRYVAYAYKDTNVWTESPKMDGTVDQRLAYWQNNGYNLLNFFSETDMKTKYLQTDLVLAASVTSRQKESVLKAIVAQVQQTNTCSISGARICFRLFSFVGMENKTSSFTIGQVVDYSKIATNSLKMNSIRDVLLTAPGLPINSNTDLKTFNFNNTSTLNKTAGHVYTARYIDMVYQLNQAIESYTYPSLIALINGIDTGEHDINIMPVNLSKVYNAPTTPGFHALYFYVHSDGNSGKFDKTVRTVICVRGANVCPNEQVKPVVKIKEIKNINQTNAIVNWSFSDANGDRQEDYAIQVSTQASFANPALIKTYFGNHLRTDMPSVRNHMVTGLSPGTVYYVQMYVTSNKAPKASDWDRASFTFKTLDTIGQCNTTIKDRCVAGQFEDTADTATNYNWRCLGTNNNNASCTLTIPVTAQCGNATSTCSRGTLAEMTDSTTDYLWQCNGLAGGGSTMCSLPKPVNPTCGSSKDTCTRGTFTEVTDSATNFLWTCNGSTGTTPVSCSVSKTATVVNGQCGTVNNTCTSGTLRSTSAGTGDDTSTNYKFYCDGSGGGINAACSVPKPVTPQCGTTNTCSVGNFSDVADTSTTNNWQCLGLYGGPTASCSSPITSTSTNPAPRCGSSISTCSSGNLFELADSSTNYLWRCDGGDGTNASCVLPIENTEPPVCGNSNKVCTGGVLKELNDSQTEYIWQCNGINTGTSLMCSAGVGTEVVNGSCSSEKDVCNSGWLDLSGTPMCKGYNGGSDDICNFTESTEPKITLTKYPLVSVKKGGLCTIYWNTQNIPNDSTCTLKGFGVNEVLEKNSEDNTSTPPLQNNQRYTLECSGGSLTEKLSSSILCRVDSTTLEN